MTRELLGLAMSDIPVNWILFHTFPLDEKLAALDLFFDEVINGLPFKIHIEEHYIFSNKLLTYTITTNLMLGFKVIISNYFHCIIKNNYEKDIVHIWQVKQTLKTEIGIYHERTNSL